MTGILTIDGNMNHGSHNGFLVTCTTWALVPTGPNGIHQLGISHAYLTVTHTGCNALSCNFFHISYFTTIGCLFRERITQGGTNGMSGEMFYMSRQV